MINVSDFFKAALDAGGVLHEEVEITFADGETRILDEEIMQGENTLVDGAASSGFPVGIALAKYMTLSIDNREEAFADHFFFGAVLKPSLRLRLANGGTERIRKGTYTITTPESYGDIITITAVDDMYKADINYTTKLPFPQTLFALVRDACDTCGISMGFSSMEHGGIVINSVPEGITFRAFLGYAAMFEVANARIDNNGYLRFVKWDFTALEEDGRHHELKNYSSSPRLSAEDIRITGIRVKNSEHSVFYGEEGYILEMENLIAENSLLQTLATYVGEALVGASFRNMEGDLFSDPTIEFGDMAFSYDRKGRKYVTPITDVSFALHGYTNVKTQSDDPIRGMSQYSGPGTKAEILVKALIQKERSARETAIENLANTLANSSGLYLTEEPMENGGKIYYAHNKPTLEKSDVVWKFAAEAIGISTDGGKTYPYGFTVTGEMITRILQAEGISAEWIMSGAFQITDNDDNEVFYADKDTGEVRINAQSIRIGGVGVITYDDLKNVKDELADAAKSLNVILSNDFHGIPADNDGNNPVYDGCGTTVKVLLGEDNISDAVTYSITKSSGVTGDWDLRLRTYTVTGLAVDSGWVDITASYLTMTATKRFSVAKIKGGEPGAVILMETNASVVKQTDMGMSPSGLTYHAYTRQGDGARQDYAGYFKVEETRNGLDWQTVYTSATAEPSVTHHLYTLLEAKPGGSLTSVSGAVISVWRPISEVRCTLYADAALTVPLEMSVATVIKDVDSLTQDQVFNILTNNGETMGIYKAGNTLWINANFIRAGLLTDLKGMNFWNLDTGEFALSSTATAGGKTIANQEDTRKQLRDAIDAVNNSISDVDRKITMEKVFDLWFENASKRGIMMDSNGRLYISFDMARGEVLKLGGENNGNGELRVYDAAKNQIGYWTKDGFYAQKGTFAGALSSPTGNIGGFAIDGRKLTAGGGDTGYKGVAVQAPTSNDDTVFAAGGTDHGNYAIWPFRVKASGATDFGRTHISEDGVVTAGEIDLVGDNIDIKLKDGIIYFTVGSYDPITARGRQITADEGYTPDYDMSMLYAGNCLEFTGMLLAWGSLQASDERKKDIKDWDERYDDFLMALPPINFVWNDREDGRTHIGIGAQTAKRLLRELGIENNALVYGGEKDGYFVDYNELHGMELGAIQKNRRLILELREELRNTGKVIEDMRDEIGNLKDLLKGDKGGDQ